MRNMSEEADTLSSVRQRVYRRTADNRVPLRPLLCTSTEHDSLTTHARAQARGGVAMPTTTAVVGNSKDGRSRNAAGSSCAHLVTPEMLSGTTPGGWGLMQLIERGKLPSSCVDLEEILTANGIMQATRARIHRNRPSSRATTVMTETSGFAQMKNIRLDYREIAKLPAKLNLTELRQWEEDDHAAQGGAHTHHEDDGESDAGGDDAAAHPPPPPASTAEPAMWETVMHDPERADPRNYTELLDLYSMHEFIIRKGKTLRGTPEFASFRRRYHDSWGSIESAILFFEKTLQRYGIELAYMDGKRVAALAMGRVAGTGGAGRSHAALTESDLLRCVANPEEVEPFLGRRVQQYRHGVHGSHAAATAIQSVWRMYTQRIAYQHIIVGTRAARLIQQQWATHRAHVVTRRAIASLREARVARWRHTMDRFVQDWPALTAAPPVFSGMTTDRTSPPVATSHIQALHLPRRRRRTIVHIPSLSYPCFHAARVPFYMAQQMGQLTRVMDLADASVEVILITPYKPEPEVVQYYVSLLTAAGVPDVMQRLTLLTPDGVARLPDKMSLTRLVLLSARLMKSLRMLTCGSGGGGTSSAYIVPGVVGPEELTLASQLNLPLLSPDSRTASVFGTKSGCQRLLEAAGVATPLGATRLHSRQEMLRALARLMLIHGEIARWLVKLETESGSRGHAYWDVRRVRCLRQRRTSLSSPTPSTSQRRHTKAHDDALGAAPYDETLYNTLITELTENGERAVRLIHTRSYPNYAAYLDTLDAVGATIQAIPPRLVASVTANLFIEPSGEVHVQSLVQPTMSVAYTVLGCTFPCASTLPYARMRETAMRVGHAAYRKHVMGYVSVDMVLFEGAGVGQAAGARVLPGSRSRACRETGLEGGWGPRETTRQHSVTPSVSAQDSPAHRSSTSPCGGEMVLQEGDEDSGEGADTLQLWGVDVDLYLTNNAAAHRFAVTLTRASYEERSGMYLVSRNRCPLRYVYSGIIYNPFIPLIRHDPFFSTAKIRAIAYHAERGEGVVHQFVDVLLRGCIGVLSIGTDMTMVVRRLAEFQRLLNLELPKQSEHSSESNFVYFSVITRQLARIWGA